MDVRFRVEVGEAVESGRGEEICESGIIRDDHDQT